MTIDVNIVNEEYSIIIEEGILNRIGDEINLNRKVLIVTDDGVPAQYANTVAEQCKESYIVTIAAGEDSKSLESFALLQQTMLDAGFTRKDCAVAVGGGVVGDLTGFAAASYMRGIDFYNVPTTILSQVDSSIGGKTAVNFGGVKNIVGAFYQPRKVVIDPKVSETLSDRLVSNGLAEAIKMACTFDEDLFEKFENLADNYTSSQLYDLIAGSIMIKKRVVEEDVRESGLRKVLNFGHTIGHGIEMSCDEKLLHGECVGIGMLMMCSDEVRSRLEGIMNKFNLPVSVDFNLDKAIEAISHDKKSNKNTISTVYVSSVGTYEFRDMTMDEIAAIVKKSVEAF